MCTYNLWDKFGSLVFDYFKVDIRKYITLSHMAYSIWEAMETPCINNRALNPSPFGERPHWNSPKIVLPNEAVHRLSILATYGGRAVNNKRFFESQIYDLIKEETNQYEPASSGVGKYYYSILGEIPDKNDNDAPPYGDYLVMLDVVSLYPEAMQKFSYPVGYPIFLNDLECSAFNDEMNYTGEFNLPCGIYETYFFPNKQLTVPVLPRKKFETDEFGRVKCVGGLIWNLEDGYGYYTSVDLELAFEAGYRFEIVSGIMWERTAPIFERYIDLTFGMKQHAEEHKLKALRCIAKVMMVALYGKVREKEVVIKKFCAESLITVSFFSYFKMLQHPMLDQIDLIFTDEEADKFMSRYRLNDIIPLEGEEGRLHAIFKGETDKLETCTTKPTYLGRVFCDAHIIN